MKIRSLIAIGKVAKAFGIQGDFVVLPLTTTPARFKKLQRVFVGLSEADAVERRIASVKFNGQKICLRLEGLADRTEAERLVGSFLFVDEENAIRLPRGTFFVHDVVGLTVVDQEGKAIGTVKDVLKLPTSDVYVIEIEGKEVMVPAVPEFIKGIDLKSKTMRVKLIDGMIE